MKDKSKTLADLSTLLQNLFLVPVLLPFKTLLKAYGDPNCHQRWLCVGKKQQRNKQEFSHACRVLMKMVYAYIYILILPFINMSSL